MSILITISAIIILLVIPLSVVMCALINGGDVDNSNTINSSQEV